MFPIEVKCRIVKIYIKNNENAAAAQREYHLLFPNERLPSKNSFKNVYNLFMETQSLHSRKRTIIPNELDEMAILLHFEEFPETSVRCASRDLGFSIGKVHKVLRKYKRKPYKCLPVSRLTHNHVIGRRRFCEIMIGRLNNDGLFFNKIMWTDECSFSTAGVFNRKNIHVWSSENPHSVKDVKFQGRRSVSVWCGIYNNKIYGPIFFQNLTGQDYLHFLQNEIEGMLEELPLPDYHRMIWHQDGAPVHNIRAVEEYLNERFDEWIGTRGTIRWAANSPDLSLLDTFLWGFLKDRCYKDPVENIVQVQERIVEGIRFLNNNPNIILSSINKLKERYRLCLEVNGQHFEQFL